MLSENDYITIRGARVHCLKNIDLQIPRNKLIVITGVSGSGKSSLAFDTIYAEGQRRYVESLSAYARQFLGRMNKPDVDFISGIPPAIAIEQKVKTGNPRSTVGTSTEIYDYLRMLFAKIGRTYSPISGKEVKRHSVESVVNHIATLPQSTPIILTAPFVLPNIAIDEVITLLGSQGYNRIEEDGCAIDICESHIKQLQQGDVINVVIDRFIVSTDNDNLSRITDSVQTAFLLGHGRCEIVIPNIGRESFSNLFESDGMVFEEPTEFLFSFNNPLGACPRCEGYGKVVGIDENLVIPDPNLSIYDNAIACWRGDKMSVWRDELVKNSHYFNFPIHKSYFQLTEEQKKLLWSGNSYFHGLNSFFEYLEKEKYKIQYRVMLSRYCGKTVCPDCKGNRLRLEASYVKIGGKNIHDMVNMPIDQLYNFFLSLKLTDTEHATANRLLKEIVARLHYLNEVGLSYLTLNRLSSTLSGGESQRINLSTAIGSNLVGSLYILDEPSIGLHPRDTQRLLNVLCELRNLGNTVIVVEHDSDIIKAADMIIDLGPSAGRFGGEIVFQGDVGNDILTSAKDSKSLTIDYLTGKKQIPIPAIRRKWHSYIEIKGARENNLKNIDVRFPLHILTAVTGVSGSGKSSLVTNTLYKYLSAYLSETSDIKGNFAAIDGDSQSITAIEMIDQNPIGKSSRSNPATYLKAYDDIRQLFAEQQLSKQNGYKPSHFSFNTEGGRCEECKGEGIIKVDMQFMADVVMVCDMCHGKRFKKEILEVKYRDKNIFDVLEMSVDEAIKFFGESDTKITKKIVEKLTPLSDVGLGYIKLGQSSGTLSGGENQRVKLAYYLGRSEKSGHILFIFDEPTTGLHFHDINKLLQSINALIEQGHSVVIIEHNMEVVKCCDWVIDLGPEGGDMGGTVIFEGTPENLAKCSHSYTGKYLALNNNYSINT